MITPDPNDQPANSRNDELHTKKPLIVDFPTDCQSVAARLNGAELPRRCRFFVKRRLKVIWTGLTAFGFDFQMQTDLPVFQRIRRRRVFY
jgi:hypothetical protein